MPISLPNGPITITNENNSTLVLDVDKNGKLIQQEANSATERSKWEVVAVHGSTELFYIKNLPNGEFLAATPGGGLRFDTEQKTASHTGGRLQQWQAIKVAGEYYQLYNLEKKLYLTCAGTKVILSKEAPHDANQNWRLAPTGKKDEPRPAQGGRLYAWGDNDNGQLGFKADLGDYQSPMEVTALLYAERKVQDIAAGTWHSLALLSDGSMRAWGHNAYGQLGVGDKSRKETPTDVKRPGDLGKVPVTAIAAGAYHSLALADGRVWAWGAYDYGRLGLGTTPAQHWDTPQEVTGFSKYAKITHIAAGAYHSLALDEDGKVWAWGYGGYGQLGLGETNRTNYFTPQEISIGDVTITDIAAGGWHSLALDDQGRVWTWGLNHQGQLGNGKEEGYVPDPTRIGLTGIKAIAAHGGDPDGRHSLARDADGRVWAWGYAWHGQLGHGKLGTSNTGTPIEVGITTKATDIAAGAYHSLATDEHGNLWSWGYAIRGQLGDDSTDNAGKPPKIIQDFGNVTAIAAGYFHSLAAVADRA